MSWEDTIKKKKYSYKRRKYPTTAQKKNKKLNRLNPAERQKKEEEMREYSRQRQDDAISRKAKRKAKLAAKPFNEKINNIKEQKDNLIKRLVNIYTCSKGHKLFKSGSWFEAFLNSRRLKGDGMTVEYCGECGEKISNDEETKKLLNKAEEVLIGYLEEIEKLEGQAAEESNSAYWKEMRGSGGY